MSKINFEEDVANIDQTGLESVAELLREQLRLENVIEDTEEQLKGYKEHLRKLSGEVIPSKMAELGMTSTTMYDGSKGDFPNAEKIASKGINLPSFPAVSYTHLTLPTSDLV